MSATGARAALPLAALIARGRSRHGRVAGLLALLIALVALAGPWRAPRAFAGDEPAPLPPLPDLAGVEAPVAAKIAAAHRFVLAHGGSAHAWGVLAMSLDVHGFALEALPCYRRAGELDARDFRWPYYRALALAAMGDAGAVAELERARALAPDYAPLAVRLGEALAAAGETTRAAEAFARAAALDPSLAHAHLGLARLALARGDLEAAFVGASRAAAAAPRTGEAHGLLAEVWRRRGDSTAAERERDLARRLPAAAPVPDPAYAALAAEGVSSFWYRRRGRAYLEQGEWRRAADEFAAALAAAGEGATAELHDDLGVALQGLGLYAEAAERHRAALAHRPAFAAAFAHLGEALAALGDVTGATAAVARALELEPELSAAALDLGTLHLRAGRRVEAAAAFRRGLAAAPDDPRLAARLAWLLATAPEDNLRDGAEAVRLAERASQATGGRMPEALDVLAAAYAEAGRFAAAAATARRSRDLARATSSDDLAKEIGRRLARYEEGEPYREGEP